MYCRGGDLGRGGAVFGGGGRPRKLIEAHPNRRLGSVPISQLKYSGIERGKVPKYSCFKRARSGIRQERKRTDGVGGKLGVKRGIRSHPLRRSSFTAMGDFVGHRIIARRDEIPTMRRIPFRSLRRQGRLGLRRRGRGIFTSRQAVG